MMLKLITQNLITLVVTAALLFGPAGTLEWPQAWIFLVLFFSCGHAIGYWLLKTNPGFLAERLKSPLRSNHTLRDQVVTALLCVTICIWIVFIALDSRRIGWSSVPRWAEVIGGALIVGSFYAWSMVLRENTYAVTSVRLQPERGQVVISTGPYAVVRHPMYAAAAGCFIGTPLLLGSLWGLLGFFAFMPLLATRALGEEAILMDGLPAYREYAATVRFRLLPGLW
jgi:protein-S-isoprenylcysteine O-methyltransferase Ste14